MSVEGIHFKNASKNNIEIIYKGEVFMLNRAYIESYLAKNWSLRKNDLLETNGVKLELEVDDFIELLHKMNENYN